MDTNPFASVTEAALRERVAELEATVAALETRLEPALNRDLPLLKGTVRAMCDADAVAEAHGLVDVYDAAVPGSSRGDDGVAGTALYFSSERDTQSALAEVADVSVVTIRNTSKEFRDVGDAEVE